MEDQLDGHSVVDSVYTEQYSQLPGKTMPIYRRGNGIFKLIILITTIIIIGAVVSGSVVGTKMSALRAQRDSLSATTASTSTSVTSSLPSTINITVTATLTATPTTVTSLAPTTTTVSAPAPTTTSTVSAPAPTTTSTVSAPSPSQSNCVWEGTAPFCDGKCHTNFTQIEEDNCGDGDCCWTGFKVFCCQE